VSSFVSLTGFTTVHQTSTRTHDERAPDRFAVYRTQRPWLHTFVGGCRIKPYLALPRHHPSWLKCQLLLVPHNFGPRRRLLWLRDFPTSVLGPVLAPTCQIANALIESGSVPECRLVTSESWTSPPQCSAAAPVAVARMELCSAQTRGILRTSESSERSGGASPLRIASMEAGLNDAKE
jgi:hypothetical protein